MRRRALVRRRARAAAVLGASLAAAASGGLVAAATAWSDGGHGAGRAHRGHRHHGGGLGTHRGAATTTTTTVTKTTTTTTTTPKTTTSKSSAKAASASKKSPPAKPKPKPKPKPPVRLTATLASTTGFPERELGLWTSEPRTLTPGQVHVTENGQPVSGLTLRPLSAATARQFGVVVVLDESSSLSTNSRGLEMAAAQAIVAERTGQQAVGVVTFSSAPTVMVPMTSDPQVVKAAMSSPPLVAPGGSLLPALSLAYSQLKKAGIATGAVIVVTAGKDLASPADEAHASQVGLGLGYQTFSTDILAAAQPSSPSPQNAKGDDDAAQERALGAQLSSAAGIWSHLERGYVASWRSAASPGQKVTVSVKVDGVVGTPTMSYTASRRAAPPPLTVPSSGHLPKLSARPSFAAVAEPAAAVGPQHSGSSFWSNPLSLALVSLICALLFGVALWLLVGGAVRSELETRVASFIPDQQEAQDPAAFTLPTTPGVPLFLARRRWWPGFVRQVEVARWRRSPVTLVKLAVAGSLVAAVLFTLVLGSAGAGFLGLPVGPAVLWLLLRRAVRKNRARFADRIPFCLQDMAGAVRGGRSMAGAMVAVVDGADEPMAGEFERAVADEQLGKPLEESLHEIAQRMRSEDMEQVALVAALHRRSGSSVAEALDHVADGARERAELIRELKSLTGQARLSSRILTGLPIFLFVVMSFMEPTYMHPLLHTTAGIAVTVLCAFMVLLGWLAMRRIVKVEA